MSEARTARVAHNKHVEHEDGGFRQEPVTREDNEATLSAPCALSASSRLGCRSLPTSCGVRGASSPSQEDAAWVRGAHLAEETPGSVLTPLTAGSLLDAINSPGAVQVATEKHTSCARS